MASTTAKWAIPQPDLADDPPDVPRDVHAAMNRVDDLLTPLSRGLFSAMPPFGKIGQRYIATDQTNQEYLDIGTAWIPLNITRGFSPGDVKASFQVADHGDWKLIDGRNNILRSDVTQEYIDLAIARGWLGSDGTRIGVPDGVGRMLVNRGVHADIDALGENDGQVAANRRPKHKHTVNEPNGGLGHAHGIADPGHTHQFQGQREDVGGSNDNVAPKFNSGQGVNAAFWGTQTSTTNITITRAVTGVTIGPQATSPVDGPAYLTVNYFIYTGATIADETGGSTGGGGGLARSEIDLATANLAAAAGESGTVLLGKSYRMIRIEADHPCRVRLYSTPAKRTTDIARPTATDPPDYPTPGSAPNHGCMLEVILGAANLEGGSYVQDLSPNVMGSSNENPPLNAIAYRIENMDVVARILNIKFIRQEVES